nr:hypothetical protein GCM10017611_06430 [Rhodococcus wratislaviensis]
MTSIAYSSTKNEYLVEPSKTVANSLAYNRIGTRCESLQQNRQHRALGYHGIKSVGLWFITLPSLGAAWKTMCRTRPPLRRTHALYTTVRN